EHPPGAGGVVCKAAQPGDSVASGNAAWLKGGGHAHDGGLWGAKCSVPIWHGWAGWPRYLLASRR
ncbi:hypothetical protein ACI3PL_26570, partial [Lacticaseibacillus paracasei]